MRFYLASSFRFKEDVKRLAQWLTMTNDHDIVCRWWEKDYKAIQSDKWWDMPEIKAIYLRSFEAIKECDILILVTPQPTEFNGANVEVGMALTLGKPVIALGNLSKSGMYQPLIRVSDYVELAIILQEFER